MANKKKYRINKLFIPIIILLMIPSIVNANIMCNDGTKSPTCENCHQGCCSYHGGCANKKYNSNNKQNSINSKKKQKKNKVNSTFAIIIGGLTYVISIILLLIIDNKFHIEDKIIDFFENHDLFSLLLYVTFLGLVISFGWISIPMYIVQNYTIYHEICSIILLTFITYCFIVIEQN